MPINIEPSWKKQLNKEFEKDYFNDLVTFVKSEYSSNTVYPPPKQIFSAFDHCPFNFTKVVILGQDPYHGPNQANGLCFSVNEGVKNPPSLQNIYKEIESDLGGPSPTEGDLSYWSEQGVLLLNATLTVQAKNAGSHQKKGWEEFTDAAIKTLSDKRKNLVFILWGKYAQNKGTVINRDNGHLILTAAHPSPFSAHNGFFGCKHFSKTNTFLANQGQEVIDW